ncbi:histone acetyltransferase type B subunit 2 [Cyclospora cayetanensis]|uniref:Histone acetyltransferase type B subunit 2 n=1 Tax=Cyclospora cayetanensis TaxID=88456 RepID=A0A6P6RZF8_9EIME|nr:histone acetyltransferase type B subunit 2 [Cyclospora cayetanensis]
MEQQMEERHLVWRKNAPFFYDAILSHRFDWPSMTVECFPPAQASSSSGAVRLLLGTATDGTEPNFLVQAEARIPQPSLEIDPIVCETYSGFTAPRSKVTRGAPPPAGAGPLEIKALLVHPGNVSRARLRPLNPLHIASCTPDGLVLFWDYSKHPSFPSSPPPTGGAAAAVGSGGGHGGGGPHVAKPQMALLGHGKASVEGLSWSAADPRRLSSADSAGVCCLWDLASSTSSSGDEGATKPGDVASGGVQIAEKTPQAHPVRVFDLKQGGRQGRAPLNDLEQHPHHPHLAAVAAEDGSCILLDWRQQDAITATAVTVSKGAAANAVSWSPQEPCVFSVGDSAGIISLFDTRSLQQPLLSLSAGSCPLGASSEGDPARVGDSSISTVRFHPDFAHLLGAATEDGTVAVWDLVAASAPQQRQQKGEAMQTGETTEELTNGVAKGPPGLLFVHAGHSAPITDFCWRTSHVPPPSRNTSSSGSSVHHLRQSLLGASVSFDNKVQLWQPSELLLIQP